MTTIRSTSVLPVVRYELHCDDRPWRVRRFQLTEALTEPYRGEVEAICDDPELEARELVGADLSLSIHRGEAERVVMGVVQHVELLGSTEDDARLVLHFGPALGLLERGHSSRVFQHKTVPEVIDELVGPTFEARGRQCDLLGVAQRGLQPRDYCVQYQESDLDFLHRLLDEEGISYRFEHEREDHETLVAMDGSEDARELEAWAGGAEVRLITDRQEEAEVESVAEIKRRGQPAGPTIVQRNWDWSANPARVYEESAPPRDDSASTVIEYGGRRLWSMDTKGIALRQQQALAASEDLLEGSGNVVAFAPGVAYELLDSDHDGRYLLTRVEHRGDAPEVDAHDGTQPAAPSYDNRFTCIPAEMPYRRPLRSAKPLIHGPQTAVVVGPEDEEIFTDEHGRIKIRLHWDRGTTAGEDASCWVRVAQTSAGPGWGSVFIPRIGMEVVISFLDGDPDRPLCTGCVFNGQNTMPYPLPENRTKTTLRTQSSPGGDGYNELCFEDAAGHEQVMLRAQRDYSETVEHDRSRSVGNDEAVSVGGGRTLAVEGNQRVTVNGKGSDGDALPSPHYGIEVDGDYSMRATDNALVEAKSSIRLRCGETLVELTPTKITLQAGKGARVVLEVSALFESKPGAFVRLDEEGRLVAQSTAPAKLSLDERAELRSKAGSQVMLSSEAEIKAAAASESASGASLFLSANADLQADEVTLTSEGASFTMTDEASLVGSAIGLSAAEITCAATRDLKMSAANLEAAGGTLTTITAPLVQIN